MNVARYAWWLTEQATSVVLHWWPITLLVASVALVLAVLSLRRQAVDRRQAYWTLSPFLIPPVILLWGSAFQDVGLGPSGALPWQIHGVYGLVLLHIPLLALMVWRIKSFRLLAVGNSVLAAWLSCGAGFVSAMSVAGDWP